MGDPGLPAGRHCGLLQLVERGILAAARAALAAGMAVALVLAVAPYYVVMGLSVPGILASRYLLHDQRTVSYLLHFIFVDNQPLGPNGFCFIPRNLAEKWSLRHGSARA